MRLFCLCRSFYCVQHTCVDPVCADDSAKQCCKQLHKASKVADCAGWASSLLRGLPGFTDPPPSLCSCAWSLCVAADFAYDVLPYLAEQTSTRLAVSLTSGLVAGVCAAIVSQPGGTFFCACAMHEALWEYSHCVRPHAREVNFCR